MLLLIKAQKNDEAITGLDNCKMIIEKYADSFSKNQNIKNDSVKRKERIKIIDNEIEETVVDEQLINESDLNNTSSNVVEHIV